jgi:hypothetical protein
LVHGSVDNNGAGVMPAVQTSVRAAIRDPFLPSP